MKNLMTVLILLGCNTVFASAGPSVSGGVPTAPRAVVLQGHIGLSGFDLVGRGKAMRLAATHLVDERVLAITQRPELQYVDRTYVCIEYKNREDTEKAATEFTSLLANHSSIEVVSNGSCQ